MRRYYLGHYVKQTNGSMEYFAPPSGVVGSLDLAPLPIQGVMANDRPMGLFVTASAILPSEYTLVGEGDCREIATTGKMQDAFQSLVGYRPQGERLVDLLYDILTDGSDPEGLSGPKPLMPTIDGWLPLYLGGHSLILNAKFEWGKPCSRGRNHWKKIQHLLRKEFEDLADQAQKGKLKDKQHHRRVLDFHCEKYKVDDWREFVPTKLQKDIPGRLKHETTITDNFDRANSSGSLGTASGGFSWANVAGTMGINTNKGAAEASDSAARAELDLSSSDHYAQVALSTISGSADLGVCARYASGANTHYLFLAQATPRWSLYKRVTGSFTEIAANAVGFSAPAGNLYKLQCNGSDLECFDAGVTRIGPITDTSITGNLRAGLTGFGTQNRFDDFEASDLAASGILYTQLERGTRGVMRGSYTKWSF